MKRHARILLFEFLLVLILLTAFPVISNAASKAPRNKLVTEQGTSYYYNHKGKIVRNRMITWKKNTYYFDKNGQMYRNRTSLIRGTFIMPEIAVLSPETPGSTDITITVTDSVPESLSTVLLLDQPLLF